MKISLEEKVVLITGASRGIGRAIALKLAKNKMNIVITARSQTDLENVKKEIEAAGSQAYCISADLMDPETPSRIIKQTVENFNQLDILINNAGMAIQHAFEETSLSEWNLHMNVNARAPFLLSQEAISYLKKSDIPTIINIASVVARKGYVKQGAYSASKHALLGFTKVLAREFQHEIKVHAISPGGVTTDMVGEMRPDLDESDLMLPEEIAEIVLFLLTHKGNAVIDEVNVRREASTPWK